jgi:sugar diacid utilization regulator
VSTLPDATAAGRDLAALDALAEAVAAGAGLPAVVRAAAQALEASLVVTDLSGAVLAVAARSTADERALVGGGAAGAQDLELRVAGRAVGALRLRLRGAPPAPLVRLVAALLAAEVERLRAPSQAMREARAVFLRDVLAGRAGERDELRARADAVGLPLDGGVSVLVARAHAHAAGEEGWRLRVLAAVERGARVGSVTAAAALGDGDGSPAEVTVVVPGDEEAGRRAADGVLGELRTSLPGHTLALGRSRVAHDPLDLPRAGNEALLAANVAEGDPDRRTLAFEETGAYRLLLSAMSEDPDELRRFYDETVAPLVAYDEQYETDLVTTVATFLDNDGNVAGTAQRLFTHRHTVRYRLERVRELTGLDVGSSDGRERLSLGLKAMRVLGVAAPSGPASEPGRR